MGSYGPVSMGSPPADWRYQPALIATSESQAGPSNTGVSRSAPIASAEGIQPVSEEVLAVSVPVVEDTQVIAFVGEARVYYIVSKVRVSRFFFCL
jgi:hypothetical protein